MHLLAIKRFSIASRDYFVQTIPYDGRIFFVDLVQGLYQVRVKLDEQFYAITEPHENVEEAIFEILSYLRDGKT